jgi:hypothetical protein
MTEMLLVGFNDAQTLAVLGVLHLTTGMLLAGSKKSKPLLFESPCFALNCAVFD